MTPIRKTKAAALSGLGFLAVVAMPGLAIGDIAVRSIQAPGQLSHVGYIRAGEGSAGHAGPGPGVMGSGYGMGAGMMGPGSSMRPGIGRGDGFGERAVPNKDLSTDDVRQFLDHRLERRGNKRFRVGDVNEIDDDTIIADIVTKENSLVERLKVDRHSGRTQQVS